MCVLILLVCRDTEMDLRYRSKKESVRWRLKEMGKRVLQMEEDEI